MIDVENSIEVLSNAITTTNELWKPAVQLAMDINRAELEAANRQELFSMLWTVGTISFAVLTLIFLWRIAQQTKRKSSPVRPISDDIEAGSVQPDREPAAVKHPKAKPPLPDSHIQTSHLQRPETSSTVPDDSLAAHPDFPYLPKN